MLESRLTFSILSVALTLIYAFGSGLWVNTGSTFYRSLNRPSWQPPEFVFGLIWPYNFLILIIISISVISLGSSFQKNTWLALYLISVIAALAWARTFYVSENLYFAAFFLLVTALATLPMTYLSWSLNTWAGVAILPYQVWLLTATSLSFGYAVLNSS